MCGCRSPAELLCKIFGHYDIESKLAVVHVSKRWRSAAHGDKSLWAVDANDVLNAVTPYQEKSSLMEGLLTHATLANAVSVTGDFTSGKPRDYYAVSCIAAEWRPFINLKKLHFASITGHHNRIHERILPDDCHLILTLDGRSLGCIWTHTLKEKAPILTTSDLVRTKSIEAEAFEEIYRSKRADFFIFRTFFSAERNQLRSEIFTTSWGNLNWLNLTLPGSSYHYLPILQHTPQISWLKLTSTSPSGNPW